MEKATENVAVCQDDSFDVRYLVKVVCILMLCKHENGMEWSRPELTNCRVGECLLLQLRSMYICDICTKVLQMGSSVCMYVRRINVIHFSPMGWLFYWTFTIRITFETFLFSPLCQMGIFSLLEARMPLSFVKFVYINPLSPELMDLLWMLSPSLDDVFPLSPSSCIHLNVPVKTE